MLLKIIMKSTNTDWLQLRSERCVLKAMEHDRNVSSAVLCRLQIVLQNQTWIHSPTRTVKPVTLTLGCGEGKCSIYCKALIKESRTTSAFSFFSFFFFLISHQFYTHQCIHVNSNRPIQHTTIPTPPRFSPLRVHTFVLYICVSTSALQTGSPVPFF